MGIRVAFLRAINVGGRVVKMDRLRDIVTQLGYTDVATFIASGNVIFNAGGSATVQAQERAIETALHDALGYEVGAFVRTSKELSAIVAARPFDRRGPETSETLHVAFLKHQPKADDAKHLRELADDVNSFAVGKRVVYWLCTTRFSDCGITGAKFERVLGQPTTLRNITTVTKLATKLE